MEPDADDGTLTDIEEALFNAEITEEEVLTIIKKLKASKSAGQDGIPPDTLMPIMLSLFNRIFDNGVYCWNSALIVPIHKKGDVNEPTNYRGISLLDILGKLFTSVINRRLTYFTNIYNCVDESQAGFREGYSTIDNAFVQQTLIYNSLSENVVNYVLHL